MNVIDQINADVFSACNAPLHGRPATYYANAADSVGVSLNVIVKPDAWKSVFDSGSTEIDFNAMPALIGVRDVATEPAQVGRGSTGARIVFTDISNVTWYVRNVGASTDYVGAYWDLALTDYNGPINGV